MKYDYVIWDFNGTIIDDAKLCLDILNFMLMERDLKTVSMDEYREIFGFPVIDYYRKVGFDFDKEPFSVTAVEFMDLYQPRSLKCQLVSNVLISLEKLQEKGYHQILISASEKNNLMNQVNHFSLAKYFDEICGINDIHATSKEALVKEWVANKPANAKILMIGDSLHDAEVASAVGAECVLVARGHQSKRRLILSSCKVYDDVKDIIDQL